MSEGAISQEGSFTTALRVKRRWRQRRSPAHRWTRLMIAAPLMMAALALFSWASATASSSDPTPIQPKSDGINRQGRRSSDSNKANPYSLDEDLLLPLTPTDNGWWRRAKRNIIVTADDVRAQRAYGRAPKTTTQPPRRHPKTTKSSSYRRNPATIIRKKVLFFEFDCKIRNESMLLSATKKPVSSINGEEDEYYDDDEVDENNQFPRDFFTIRQRRKGAVLLHLFGLVYMFIALAIVCDEFFVPALGVITEKLDISEDVAGATFMAAGGSAPEFFTSVIGVFIAQNNVGIGTIVGSATFNILCVLAFCTLFSTTVLQLTWWPLFRDVTFYVCALFMLVVFFLDEKIVWWEALSLFLVYICYASFMKFNANVENLIKSKFGSTVEPIRAEDEEQQAPIIPKSSYAERNSGYSELEQTTEFTSPITNNNNNNNHGTRTAPLAGGILTNRQQHPMLNRSSAGMGSLQRSDSLATANNRRRTSSIASGVGGRRQSIPILHSGAMFRNGIMQLMSQTLDPLTEGEGPENGEITPTTQQREFSGACIKHTPQNGTVIVERQPILNNQRKPTLPHMENGMPRPDSVRSGLSERRSTKADIEQLKSILEEEEEKPLDMSWPDRWHKRLLFLFLVPILFPLWITVPDVRREESKKYYPMTFIVSIFWIAVFSYLMVWWANTIGETFIIGLTILAAGTSIPDLITRLPVPWLIYFIVEPMRGGGSVGAIAVSSNGLICSVGVLFIMLVLLVAAIGMCGWQMNKLFGVIMIISYVAFCALSVSLETGRFVCPLRLC